MENYQVMEKQELLLPREKAFMGYLGYVTYVCF